MKVLKFLFAIFLTLLCFAAIGVALLPSISSTQSGKHFLLNLVNSMIPGEIRAEKLELAWSHSSQVKNLELYDVQGTKLAQASEVHIDNSLWNLLTDSNPEPLINLKNLNATVIADEEGITNIQRALSSDAAEKPIGKLLEPIFIENADVTSEVLSQCKRVKIAAKGTTRQGQLMGSFALDGDIGKDIHLNLEAKKIPVVLIDQIVQLKTPEAAGLPLKILGEEMDLTLTIDNAKVEQEVSTPWFSSSLTGKIEEGTFTLLKPMTSTLHLTKEAFFALKKYLKLENIPDLSKSTDVEILTKSLILPLEQPIHLQGQFELLTSSLSLEPFDLSDVKVVADISPIEPQLTTQFFLEGKRKGEPFKAEGSWVMQNRPYSPTLNAFLEQKSHFTLKLKDEAEKISLDAEGSLDHEELAIEGSVKGPKFYAEQFSIKSTGIPWEENLKTAKITGTFSAEKVGTGSHFAKIYRAPWVYDGRHEEGQMDFSLVALNLVVDGKVKIKNKGDDVEFKITQSQGTGKINLNGKILHPMQDMMSANIVGELDRFPTDIIASYLPTEENYSKKIHALFGSEINGKLSANIEQMNGPINLALKGERCALDLDGTVKSGVLTLNRPLSLDVTLSREVSDHFLDDLMPLLNSATHADQPIRLMIGEKGFSVPLTNPSIQTLKISSGTLSLGKIYFTKEGKLAQVISLLHIKPRDSFSVWFTPLYFSLQEGKLELNRLDMLVADQYPIASWGWVNFVSDVVHMEVGLTGKALANAFGPLPLPKSYMLAIPLRGTTQNPRLDTTKIAAKLTSIAAMTTGPQGLLVGALIQLASGTLTDKIPDPTTKPLPWDTDAPETEITDSTSENPVNDLKKGAEKLFNNLFGH